MKARNGATMTKIRDRPLSQTELRVIRAALEVLRGDEYATHEERLTLAHRALLIVDKRIKPRTQTAAERAYQEAQALRAERIAHVHALLTEDLKLPDDDGEGV